MVPPTPQDVWAVPPSPAVSLSAAATLEHIKDDLKAFSDGWRREMRELSAGLRREVCLELNRCFTDALGLVSSRPCTPGGQTMRPCTAPGVPDRWAPETHDINEVPIDVEDEGFAAKWRPNSAPIMGSVLAAWSGGDELGSAKKTSAWTLEAIGEGSADGDPDATLTTLRNVEGAPPMFNVPQYPAGEPAMIQLRQRMETPPTYARPETPPESSSSATSLASDDASPPHAYARKSRQSGIRASRRRKVDVTVQKRRTTQNVKGPLTKLTRFSILLDKELGNLQCNRELMRRRFSPLRFVKHPAFDYIIFVVLGINAVTIGLQVDQLASDPGTEISAPYRALNVGFTVLFAGELVLRALAFGSQFFMTDDYLWNVFDVIVVLFSILDEVAQVFLVGTAFFRVIERMGVLRLLRVGRIARVVRMVRIIPTLKSMVYLIMASMPSFVWTVVLMIMLMFCIAVYFTEVATDLLRLDLGEDALAITWGSVGSSIMSLWSAITGGNDWRDLTDTFGDNGFSTVNLVLFSFYISFAVLVMLNLVTGVFVEGMQRIIRDDKERELVKTAVAVFDEADIDHNEDLDEDEFQAIIRNEALDEYFFQIGIQPHEASQLFHVLDTDQSGSLTLAEFVYGCIRITAPARLVDVAISERNIKWAVEDLHREVVRISEAVSSLADQVKRAAKSNSLPDNDTAGREGKPMAGEKQGSVFLHQRYLYEWEMGITEDA